MSHFSLASRATATLALGAAMLASAPVLAQTWAPTATKAIPLANAVDLGPLPAGTAMHFTIGLKLRDTAGADAFLQSSFTPGSPVYGRMLTPQEFTSSFAATAADAQAVADYLASMGFANIEIAPNRMLITATGTAGAADAAFNTSLEQFQLADRTVFANTRDAQVPAALGNVVLAVLGLTNAVQMQTHVHPNAGPPSLNSFLGYGPQQFQQAYNADATTPPAATVPIAVFGWGDMTQVLKDLAIYEKTYKLPAVPVTVVGDSLGGHDLGPLGLLDGTIEWDLDTQVSTGLAGNVKQLYIYDIDSPNDVDITPVFNRFASDNLAKAGNASFGACEGFAVLDGSMALDDQIFREAATQGQTVFTSSGDAGASCGVITSLGVPDGGVPMQGYPASSPYVNVSGGTTLFVNDDGTYDTEIAWNGGGGGFSYFEYSPWWQENIVPTHNNNFVNGGRGIPDTAMDADSTTPPDIVNNGASTSVGGTSVASPLAMGAWARILHSHNNAIGFAPPILYSFATGFLDGSGTPQAPSVVNFNDVIAGSNGLYFAAPGWDYTTGLGSFNIAAINKAIKMPATAAPPGKSTDPVPAAGAFDCGSLLVVGLLAAGRRRRR